MRTGNNAPTKRAVDPSAETSMEKKQKIHQSSVNEMLEIFKKAYRNDETKTVYYDLPLPSNQIVRLAIIWNKCGDVYVWVMSRDSEVIKRGESPNFDAMMNDIGDSLEETFYVGWMTIFARTGR